MSLPTRYWIDYNSTHSDLQIAQKAAEIGTSVIKFISFGLPGAISDLYSQIERYQGLKSLIGPLFLPMGYMRFDIWANTNNSLIYPGFSPRWFHRMPANAYFQKLKDFTNAGYKLIWPSNLSEDFIWMAGCIDSEGNIAVPYMNQDNNKKILVVKALCIDVRSEEVIEWLKRFVLWAKDTTEEILGGPVVAFRWGPKARKYVPGGFDGLSPYTYNNNGIAGGSLVKLNYSENEYMIAMNKMARWCIDQNLLPFISDHWNPEPRGAYGWDPDVLERLSLIGDVRNSRIRVE